VNRLLQSFQDDDLVIERDSDAKSEGLKKGESRQQNDVQRVVVTLPVQDTKVDDGTEQRDVEGPWATRSFD
jgi:hypothetical protein